MAKPGTVKLTHSGTNLRNSRSPKSAPAIFLSDLPNPVGLKLLDRQPQRVELTRSDGVSGRGQDRNRSVELAIACESVFDLNRWRNTYALQPVAVDQHILNRQQQQPAADQKRGCS